MKETRLNLDATQKRPVIKIMSLDAMIDTGAEISVCNLPENVFELIFEYESKEAFSIYGFGRECEGTKYIIRKLEIGEMVFTDVPFLYRKRR